MTQLVESELDGVVAQLVERLVRNEKVAGSIPVVSTILNVLKGVRFTVFSACLFCFLRFRFPLTFSVRPRLDTTLQQG